MAGSQVGQEAQHGLNLTSCQLVTESWLAHWYVARVAPHVPLFNIQSAELES
jgi:hypothetical protein